MAERLTVVFENDAVYRRLKVQAAQSGMPMKRLVEDALLAFLGPETPAPKAFDWNAYDRWQKEVAVINQDLDDSVPDNLSDVKHYLYDHEEKAQRRPGLMLAEERTPYDAG